MPARGLGQLQTALCALMASIPAELRGSGGAGGEVAGMGEAMAGGLGGGGLGVR